MIDSNIIQMLQQLAQKQRGVDAQTLGQTAIPSVQAPALSAAPKPATGGQQQAQQQPSFLGFMGGMGDTPNTQTGVADPSILTQLNNYIKGNQLPWQQSDSEKKGQGLISKFTSLFSE